MVFANLSLILHHFGREDRHFDNLSLGILNFIFNHNIIK